MLFRDSLQKLKRSDGYLKHEIVFSVHQQNLEELERTVLDRSTPGNDLYQQWLTYEEIGEMTRNEIAVEAIKQWLVSANVTIAESLSRYDHYIQASAPVSTWEVLFKTYFFEWEDRGNPNGASKHTLAEDYSLPHDIHPHISAAFYTCQAPPIIDKHHRLKQSNPPFKTVMNFGKETEVLSSFDESTLASSSPAQSAKKSRIQPDSNNPNGPVTVSFIDYFYQIPSNIGEKMRQYQAFQSFSSGETRCPALSI